MTLRDRLRAAIAEHGASSANVSRLRDVVSHANAVVAEATAALARAEREAEAHVDSAATALADSLRAGATPYVASPTPDTALADAQHWLHTATAAHDELVAELKVAEHAAERAAGVVYGWATQIVIADAVTLAEEYFAAQRRADHLRSALEGFGALWITGASGRPHLITPPQSIIDALALTPHAENADQWTHAFRTLHAALMTDRDAALVAPELSTPSSPAPVAWPFATRTPNSNARQALVDASRRIEGAEILPAGLPAGLSAVPR
jgi:hypothetical protein